MRGSRYTFGLYSGPILFPIFQIFPVNLSSKSFELLKFFFFKKPLICAHQGWIYLIKNIVQISNVVKIVFFKF